MEEPEEEEIIEFIPEMVPKIVIEHVLRGDILKVHDIVQNPKERFIFFYRKIDEGIPTFDNASITDKNMPDYFYVGVSTGNILYTLNYTSKHVSLFFNFLLKIFHFKFTLVAEFGQEYSSLRETE